MKETKKSRLAALPSVDSVLNSRNLARFRKDFGQEFLTHCVRSALSKLRQELSENKPNESSLEKRGDLLKRAISLVQHQLHAISSNSIKRVVNGTGIILHTGLGRAPLPDQAFDHLNRELGNYCMLELDPITGERGDRNDHISSMLCFLTGAEGCLTVNNNAAAVLLSLHALARGKEVIISRGQLIEIGGSFRLPDVMKVSGARMQEVGTTNKTRLADYERAINKKTAAILVAHTSNYKVVGFTEDAPLAGLVRLAHKMEIPLIYDLGGGVMSDLTRHGLPYEPVIPEVIKKGVDIVTFSGDKVLGGPQCGVIVGKKRYIAGLRKNPMARALRCDKLILAALEATLKIYLKPRDTVSKIPVMRMLTEAVLEQEKRAKRLIRLSGQERNSCIRLSIKEGIAKIGSGALPIAEIPSIVVEIESETLSPDRISSLLRSGPVPIIAYIKDQKVLLNLRTIRRQELEIVAERLKEIGWLNG